MRSGLIREAALLLAAICLLPAIRHGAVADELADEACELALTAQRYALNVHAQIVGLPVPEVAELEESVAPDEDVIEAARQAIATLHAIPQPSNLVTAFFTRPYSTWGNKVFQIAMSQAIHAPAATLGEMMYAANTLEALAAEAGGLLPYDQANEAWTSTWAQLGDNLLAQVEGVEDKLSQRSLLQRSMTYHWLAYYPQPASMLYDEAYDNVTETFKQAMSLYDSYNTTLFSYPYSNGTAEGNLDATLVTPLPGVKRPLMVVVGNAHVWKELLFMRYGLGAMRRNFAVLVFDQPGQGHALRNPPYFGQTSNFTNVISSLLDTIEGDERLAQHVDFDKVVLVGVSIGSYSAANAVAGLGDRVAALVVNPGITSLAEQYIKIGSFIMHSTMQLVVANNATLLPNMELVQAFVDPRQNIMMPLLTVCGEDSDAPALMSTAFQWAGVPDVYYVPASLLGLHLHSPQELLDASWSSFKRLIEQYNDNPARDITVPVLIMGGEQDDQMGGQENLFYESLNDYERREQSVFKYWRGYTGAALGAQIGTVTAWEQVVYPFLANVLETETASAAGRR